MSDIKNKILLQEIITSNIVSSSGSFHSEDFNLKGFSKDLKDNFSIKVKTQESEDEIFNKILKNSLIKTRGRINSKEIKMSKFLENIFDNLEIVKL